MRDVCFRVGRFGAPLDLQHDLSASARVSPMQACITKLEIFEGGDGPFPDVGIHHVRPGSRQCLEPWEIRLVAGLKFCMTGHFSPHPIHIQITRLNLPIVANANSPCARAAIADYVYQSLRHLLLQDVDQLIPVRVREHPPLLLIDT